MFKIDDYIRFVNIKNNNMFLFLSQFIEMKTNKTINMITKEYCNSLGHCYMSFLNYMKKYATNIDTEKLSEKYVNVKSFEMLCLRAKL
jgi:hypothetical protein